MSQSQYRGSQAFNQILQYNEYVNKNTGSLFVQVPLVHLRGKTEAISLGLAAYYQAGTAGLLGLPDGWSYNLPFVAFDQNDPSSKTLTVEGKTFVIDPDWQDSSGYQSGLKYVNDHGQKFTQYTESQPLPVGEGEYIYKLAYNDGGVSYFDATGLLVVHTDIFGNSLQYSYINKDTDIFDNYLESITDSFGQTVSFSYLSNTVEIHLPDGSTQTINYSDNGIANVVNQIGALIRFEYTTASDTTVIANITYTTGLLTNLYYSEIDYLDQAGSEHSFPAIREIIHLDAQGNKVDSIEYTYGSDTDRRTFTGYAIGCRLSATEDCLMSGDHQTYQYDTLEQRFDAQGNRVAASRVYYNFLHCPLHEHHYLLDEDRYVVEAYRTSYTYEYVSDAHDRSVNMSKPVSVAYSVHDADGDSWIEQSRTETSYDDYGKILSSKQYDLTFGSTELVSERKHSYVEAGWGGEMPLETVNEDLIENKSHKLSFGLSDNAKTIASVAISQKLPEQSAYNPFKTKSFFYDESGQPTRWDLDWTVPNEDGENPDETISNSFTQSFDSGTGRLSVSLKDANGGISTTVFDMRLPTGPCVEQTTPEGHSYRYTYDASGRLTSSQNPLGTTVTYSYGLVHTTSGSSEAAINYMLVHNENGYEVRTTYDENGRKIKQEDNGDPTQENPQLTRVLSVSTYNALGLLARHTDLTGQVISVEYDGLGREIKRTDSIGNEFTVTYEDVECSKTMAINGDRRNQVKSNGLGQVIQNTLFAFKQADLPAQARLRNFTYDGFGQQMSVSDFRIKDEDATFIAAKTYAYDPSGSLLQTAYIGIPEDEDLRVASTTSLTRDLLGNTTMISRQIVNNDQAQPEVNSDTLTFDKLGNLVTLRNQLGQEERREYNSDGKLSLKILLDGTQFSYGYDDAGRLTSIEAGDASFSYNYLPNGRLQQASHGTDRLIYEYSLDGTASSVTYSDGSRVQLEKDSLSRVISMSLPGGARTSYEYDGYNRISQQTTRNVVLTNTWGTVNNIHGILVGQSVEAGMTQNTVYDFDAFSQISQLTTTDANNAELFRAQLTRNDWPHLSDLTIRWQNETGETVETTRSMTYNGLEQLVGSDLKNALGEVLRSETFSYDGAGNILSHSVDGKREDYEYNVLNQLTSHGAVYDTNGRMIQDVDGKNYTFDGLGLLTAVQPANQPEIQNTYTANGMLSSVDNGSATDKLYTVGGSFTSVETKSDTGNGTHHALVWSQNQLVAQTDETGAVTFSNAANSVRLQRTPTSSNQVEISDYGTVSAQSSLIRPNSFNWNGQYTDPDSELTFMRARWYSPAAMRFLSMDPQISLNRYAYADGNPIGKMDPLGLDARDTIAFGMGFAVGLSVGFLLGGPLGAWAGESLGASLAASALTGALSATAGDLAASAVLGNQITGKQIAIDILSGGAGGAAGVGMERVLRAGAGEVFAGAASGLTDAAMAGGITAIAYNQPFFSQANVLGLALGAGTGGITARYSRSGSENPMASPAKEEPVLPVTEAELGTVSSAVMGSKKFHFYGEVENITDPLGHLTPDPDAPVTRNRRGAGGEPLEHVNFLSYKIVDGEIQVGTNLHTSASELRPISQDLFIKHLETVGGFKGHQLEIITNGSFDNAQQIADALQVKSFNHNLIA